MPFTKSEIFNTSAFDHNEGCELTEWGKSFIHYTMNELVIRLN